MFISSFYRVKDVAATFSKAKGKHGRKEESTEKYAKTLKKKFLSIVGAPAWADLSRNAKQKEQDDSDDEFFRVSYVTLFKLANLNHA